MTTAELADRYSSLTFAELPGPVVTRVHASVLDILGCMVAGRSLPSTTILAGLTPDLGGSGPSTAVTGGRVSAPWAGLVNATSAHGVELDDTDNSASLHPGNVVIPAALAVAQAVGADGARTAAAIVAGYDAMIRIGRAAGAQRQYERGFHPTATCGVFGAAVAAGSLLDLDAGQLARALGVAGSFSAGQSRVHHRRGVDQAPAGGRGGPVWHPGRAAGRARLPGAADHHRRPFRVPAWLRRVGRHGRADPRPG